jgi:Na+-transporting NADH:ubiquinone oxidoreductase subunit NqrB
MIQRIQSLLLLFSTLLSALLLYLPVYELISVPDNVSVVTRFTIMSSALLVILNGGIGILSFFAIFLYRTRNIQIRMCNLALLLSCVLIGLLFFVADTMSTSMNQKIHYLYGSYIPLIQVLIIFLATRAIKRDENLIRSADRLR